MPVCAHVMHFPPPALILLQDNNYRNSCIKYNMKRLETLDEVEKAVDVSYPPRIPVRHLILKQATVQFNYDFLEAIGGLITAFSNAQACVPHF